MKAPRETDLVRDCLAYLQLLGVPSWRQNTGCTKIGKRLIRFGVVGGSDILGLLPPTGRLLAVETKSPTGRLRASQKVFLDTIARAGGLALVVRDIRELQEALREVGIG